MTLKLTKPLYSFTQKQFQKHRQGASIEYSPLAKQLHTEFSFGQLDRTKEQLVFTLTDIIELSKDIKCLFNVDIRHDPYPEPKQRLARAGLFRNEKFNSYSVSKDFVLVNSLTGLNINHQEHALPEFSTLGLYIKSTDIHSVEHSAIVLVENLAVMANLDKMNLPSVHRHYTDKDIDLNQALWLYRGDIKTQQSTATSYHFFRRFKKETPLVCFSDFDPKGIEIALTSKADYWLTVENFKDITMLLAGTEQEWFKQGAARKFLEDQMSQCVFNENERCWANAFNQLLTHRKTLKQEHMLKHNLALNLVNLNSVYNQTT